MSPKPELRPVKPETDTETDPLIEAISTPVTAPDPFDLEKLKLDQNFVESAGVKKLLTKVPVRKPDPQRFVQVHPGKDYRMALAVILLNEESETFLLTPPLARELAGEFVMVMMRTVITKQGTVFLWPIRLADANGKINEWHKSAADAAESATKEWLRIISNKAIRGYELKAANPPITTNPAWPDLSFQELVRIAFRDRLVDRLDHPVVKLLRSGG